MKSLALVGASGRMGTEIQALAREFEFNVVAVTRSSPLSALRADSVDIVIDVSLPEATDEVVKWCVSNKKPLVSAVTGLSATQKAMFDQKSIAALWAPNMSLGVAVLSRMLREFAALKGYDFQIEELHHTRKKDKPSGTALHLQEKLEKAIGHEAPAPLAIRGGGIFGIHRVWAMGEEETITLEHNAMNRRVFARGALKSAQWLLGQKPGLYTIDDTLG